MINTISVNEPTEQCKPNATRSVNRSIFLVVLFASTLFSIFAVLGASEATAVFLSAMVTLLALQGLLRESASSPLEVLKRYREVGLPTATGVAVLLFVMSGGLSTFAAVFTPRLYSVLELAQFKANSAWELMLLILGIVVIAPFYEELIFRGLALRVCQNVRSTLFAVLFTSAVFGLIHGSIIQAFVLLPVGIVFALVMLKTGQLWTAIAAHALHNLIGVVFMQLEIAALPATPAFGILGLLVAAAAFYLAVRWLGLPKALVKEDKSAERKSIWTTSLIAALIITALNIALTTYLALGPGVEAIL